MKKIETEGAFLESICAAASTIRTILELSTSAVGVRLAESAESHPGAARLEQHRFCQALTLARHGARVVLGPDGIACPAAAAAFGFRGLPDGLRSGKGLVGFGIISEPPVGKRMFEDMPKLEPGRVDHLYLFPLEKADCIPDVVVVEGEIEKLMWIMMGYLHLTGGRRIAGSTAVLQAVCVDATILPFLEQRLNYGFGCYGCRDATDIDIGESIVGFPVSFLPGITAHLEYLGRKAIPASRGKNAWRALLKKPGKRRGEGGQADGSM